MSENITTERESNVRESNLPERNEDGATTAEYAVCTGAGVGFAGVLYKFLTSEAGQELLKVVWSGIKAILPF